jgi:hypothetical protein
MVQVLLQMDLLRSQVLTLEQTNAQLQREVQQLRVDNQKLQDQIARLKRDSSNSSKPPKKKPPRGQQQRQIEGQEGHPRQERIPFGTSGGQTLVNAERRSPRQVKTRVNAELQTDGARRATVKRLDTQELGVGR